VRERTVTFRFSEFVDKASVVQAISVQPATPWEARWDWWGKTLRLRFLQPLDSTVTYVVTLGSEYRDLAGNTAETATSVVFSPGERIHRGRIDGHLLEPQPAGVFVWAYPLSVLEADTLNPAHTPPPYRTQIGTAGTFSLQGLPRGVYRVFAIRDVDRNGLYTDGQDAFGTSVSPVVVREDTPAVVVLRLNPPVDRTPPEVVDIRPQSRQRIQVLFSEPLDTLSVHAAAFSVEDTVAADTLPVVAAFLVPGSATAVELLLQHPADTLVPYVLRLREDGVRDTAGNQARAGTQRWHFRFRSSLDTAAVRWARIIPADSSRSLLPWQPLELVAEAPLDSSAAELWVEDARGQAVPIRWEVRAANHWRIFPLSRWSPGQWYRWTVRFRTAQLPGGRRLADTAIVRHFQVYDTRHYAELAGELYDSLGCQGPYVLLLRALQGAAGIWRQSLQQPGGWRFTDIPPGFYELEVFCDADGNGRYSAGAVFPYRFAERFRRMGPIEVKPRWSVEGITVKLP